MFDWILNTPPTLLQRCLKDCSNHIPQITTWYKLPHATNHIPQITTWYKLPQGITLLMRVSAMVQNTTNKLFKRSNKNFFKPVCNVKVYYKSLFKELQNILEVKTGSDTFYNEKPLLESGYEWVSEVSNKWWNSIAKTSYPLNTMF